MIGKPMIPSRSVATLAAVAILSALFAGAARVQSAKAQVYLPCAPDCTVDPCKLAPERCTTR